MLPLMGPTPQGAELLFRGVISLQLFCHCRGGPSRRGAHSKVRLPGLLEVLSALEGDEFDSNSEEIFFAHPPPPTHTHSVSGDFTDEDSGEEDHGQNGTQSPGWVLHASVVSEDSDPQEEGDYDKPELKPVKKRQRTAVEPRRVWTERDSRPDVGCWTAQILI